MRRLKRKLKKNSGETIAETLVALLISALALMMLAGAIGSAFHIIETGRNKEAAYYAENEKLSEKLNTDDTEKITIAGINGEITIMYYRNDVFSKTPVISYKKSGL